MAAQSTYTPIGTLTASGSNQTLSFTNIPSTYTDLVLVCFIRSQTSGTTDSVLMQVNSTQSIYSDTTLSGNGSAASSTRGSNTYGTFIGNCPAAGSTSGIFGSITTHIENYANTTTYKTQLSKNANDQNGSGYSQETVGLMRLTGAINNVTVLTASANITVGSTATLYGITAA